MVPTSLLFFALNQSHLVCLAGTSRSQIYILAAREAGRARLGWRDSRSEKGCLNALGGRKMFTNTHSLARLPNSNAPSSSQQEQQSVLDNLPHTNKKRIPVFHPLPKASNVTSHC